MGEPRNCGLRWAAGLAAALLAGGLQAADHHHHHGMDHAGMAHPGMGAATAPTTQEHAHHHPVTEGYTRSERDYTIPDLALVGADGRPVPLREELAGNGPVMLNFIFTTCTAVCPVMSATFARVQSLLGEEARRVRLVSISVDPEQDTPERLRAYAARFGASPQWHFLTGTLADSVQVQRAFDVYRGGKMNHVALTLLRASPNAPWVRLEGLAGAEDIVREYRALAARGAAPSLGQHGP